MIGEFVLVRCRDAGVHCGILEEWGQGQVVVLIDARRLWRWRGANTLHEIATEGPSDEYTRISQPVPRIALIDAIEVIPCGEKATKNLRRSRWPS